MKLAVLVSILGVSAAFAPASQGGTFSFVEKRDCVAFLHSLVQVHTVSLSHHVSLNYYSQQSHGTFC